MLTDAQGLAVTTERPETVRAIDRFVEQFLGYGSDLKGILEAAEADRDCVVAQAHAGLLTYLMETGKAAAEAKPILAGATLTAALAGERERLYLWAVSNWTQGEPGLAVSALKALIKRYPRDLMAAALAQLIEFTLGDAAGMLHFAEASLEANGENAYAHANVAFALEECGRLEEAEAAGRRATDMRRDNPWAHHAVAHVMEMQGRPQDGIAWMMPLADCWETCNSFMYTHNWWHVALFHLDLDDHAGALQLYDRRIWGRVKTYSQDQVNAVSMLARLELRQVDVGERWQDLASYLEGRIEEHVHPFLDLHYLYGLARAGRDQAATRLVASIEAHVGKVKPFMRPIWEDVAVPLARGLVLHARGQHGEAVSHLVAVLAELHRIGGSHAQRDLFTQILLDALIRAGYRAEARAVLEQRRQQRPGIPAIERQLASLAA
ncbi:MAG: tetratricopeptide repeat protein [Proteobacteria bacterium]|nr:tetratricopeptide repeat protein [Pseudomonadota bacterium]MBI3497493.1 tetratricopeptide repeat protein [Pseudomonadota bacterium]